MKRVFKWLGLGLAMIVALVVVLFVVGYARTRQHIARVWHVNVHAVAIPTDAASIAEGQRLYSVGCFDCHGAHGEGKAAIDDSALGRFESQNLTRGHGGVGATFTDADWVRAIRHGIKPDGRPILLMPSADLYHLTDREVGELVAYLKSLPPVDRVAPPSKLGPVVYLAYGVFGKFPLINAEMIDHDAPRPKDVAPAVSPDFGKHLVDLNCRSCHGETLSGGPLPGAPPSLPVPLNLTPEKTTGLGSWTLAQFKTALRTGVRPDGRKLDPFMPWSSFSHLSDEEISALWLYLQSVPPKPFGDR